MSKKNKEKKKLEKSAAKQAEAESGSKKVLMRFSEDKFYNDSDNPIFEKGKVYELEGKDWIYRWMKRGGEIVEGDKLEAEKGVSKIPEPSPTPDVKPIEKEEASEPEQMDAGEEFFESQELREDSEE